MKMFLLGMLVMYLGIFIVTLLVGFFTQICEDTFLEHIFMFPLLIIYWIIKIIVVPFLKILDNFKKWWYNNYRKTESEVIIMDVIMVHEDNHGILGVAINYTSAIDMLVENKWLDTVLTKIYVGNYEYKTLDELGITIEDIKKWGIDKFNEEFDGLFYLGVAKIYGMWYTYYSKWKRGEQHEL